MLTPALSTLYAQAKLQVLEGTKFDLGSISRGAVVEKKITLRNTGNDTLVLGTVEASCGCTGTVVSKDRIPAGATGTLLITFNSKNFTGPVHKTLTVNSNAADEPRTVIEFTASVVEEIVVTPAQVWFKDAEVGRPSTVIVTVKNQGKEKLELRGYRTQLSGFTLKVPSEPVISGKTIQLVAEFTPAKPIPVLADGVFLKTSNPLQPEIFIPIYGNAKEFKFE